VASDMSREIYCAEHAEDGDRPNCANCFEDWTCRKHNPIIWTGDHKAADSYDIDRLRTACDLACCECIKMYIQDYHVAVEDIDALTPDYENDRSRYYECCYIITTMKYDLVKAVIFGNTKIPDKIGCLRVLYENGISIPDYLFDTIGHKLSKKQIREFISYGYTITSEFLKKIIQAGRWDLIQMIHRATYNSPRMRWLKKICGDTLVISKNLKCLPDELISLVLAF